jgi:hypothetical protein
MKLRLLSLSNRLILGGKRHLIKTGNSEMPRLPGQHPFYLRLSMFIRVPFFIGFNFARMGKEI